MKRARLIQRRKIVGLSQEVLAEQLGVDRATVFRWEHGDTTPQPWQRPNLATALQISVEELEILLTDFGSPHVGSPSVASLASYRSTEASDDLAVMQSFRLADRQVGGGHLYPTVTSYLQYTIAPRLFGCGGSPGDEADVFAAAAGLTEMAGWMAHDAGRDLAAEQHFHRALRLANAGRDTQLVAHVIASLSHLAHHQDRADLAVRLAREGRFQLTATEQSPEIQSRLFAMEARGHALSGQYEMCVEHLHRAERALDGHGNTPRSPWISQFDHAALAAEKVRCYRQLGQPSRAARCAQEVVSLRPADRPRSRAFAQLTLATILVQQGDLDQACATAAEVLHSTRELSSALVVDQLVQLSRALMSHRGAPEAVAFVELLGQELATRRSKPWYLLNHEEKRLVATSDGATAV